MTGPVPSELGLLSLYDSSSGYSFTVEDNSLTGALPSQLGGVASPEVNLGYNSLSSSVPTQLGQLQETSFISLASNELSAAIPTELGMLERFAWEVVGEGQSDLSLWSNKLCGALPTEVQALSARLEHFAVTTGNSIGTVCGWIEDDRVGRARGCSRSTTSLLRSVACVLRPSACLFLMTLTPSPC